MALKSLLICASALALASPAMAQTSTNVFGQPDLSGFWTNATLTGLERPATFGDRLAMTADEAKAVAARSSGQAEGFGARVMSINGEPRTSFITAPASGQFPGLSPASVEARNDRISALPHGSGYLRGDNPESLTLAERCLKDFGSSSGPPMMPVGYNNTYQIVQTADHVMILIEMVHDARIIPLTKDRKRPANIKQWMGDSIGWYDGDTLVVETTNFRSGQAFASAPEGVHLVERFKRASNTQIVYSFEIAESGAFNAPVKAEIAFNATTQPLYEYACHEGNYSMATILGGKRAKDVEAEAKWTKAFGKR